MSWQILKASASPATTRLRPYSVPGRITACAAKGGTKGRKAPTRPADDDETSKQMQLLSALSDAPKDGSVSSDSPNEEEEEDMGVTVIKKGKAKKQREVERLEGSLYSYPRIYDWAFGYRDYEEEVWHVLLFRGTAAAPAHGKQLQFIAWIPQPANVSKSFT